MALSSKRIIIHVGMPKTATTFLQKEIFSQLENVLYWNKHQYLHELIRNLPFRNIEDFDIDEVKMELESQLGDIKEEFILISHESLFGHPFYNFSWHKENAQILNALFPEAHILVTIRKQDDFIESLYLHSIQVGFAQKLNRFLNYDKNNKAFGNYAYNKGLNVDVHQLNYCRFISVYEDLFGKNKVDVKPFELFKEDKMNFLKSIYDNYGLSEFFPANKKKKVNRSYSFYTAKIARFGNRFFINPQSNGFGFIPQQPFRKFLLRHHHKSKIIGGLLILTKRLTFYRFMMNLDRLIRKNKKQISPDIRKKIMDIHTTSNQELDSKYQLNLKDYKYY
jgi:hypothetical protein